MTSIRKAVLVLITGFCAIAAGSAAAQQGAQDADFVAAAGRGDLTAVNALLKAGVSPDASLSGRTAIVAASITGQLGVVKALLAAKADPEAGAATATSRRSALIWALRSGHDAVALALVKGGANLLARDEDGTQALWLAAGRSSPEGLAVVEAMKPVSAVADLESALFPAVQSGSAAVVKLLLVTGVRVDGAPGAYTPLMLAASRGRADVMRVLLAAGADVNARRGDGSTALMDAASGGRAEAVQVLLAAKADVNARTSNGSTALMVAVPPRNLRLQARRTSLAIVRLLEEAEEVDVRGTRVAAPAAAPVAAPPRAPDAAEIVRMLLDAGADVGARRSDGYTAVTLAAAGDYQELLTLMERVAAPARN